MCGIAGFTGRDEAAAAVLAAALRHRGPDQSGVWADAAVSLAHARLSIIDLSDKARQPLANEDGTLRLVCNGEIYNFRELRRELEGKHTFASDTDVEVILHAYEEWGLDAVRRFNGMWAFCLYDVQAGKLVLSRDRAGKKPLYYLHDGARFVFASELKGILAAPRVERRVSREALDFYFSLGYIPSPLTVFEGISKMEPRQILVFDLKTGGLERSRYFEIPRTAPERDRGRLVREGRALLGDAVRLRLTADVPVGAFLSGGLDSSAVVASMAGMTDPANLHTFSIGFDGPYDETAFMEIVRRAFGTRHHHRRFTASDFDRTLAEAARFYDEPFDDAACYPTLDLSSLARESVTVSLSGDGGDEIFGGDKMHRRAARHAALRRIPAFLRRGLRRLLRRAGPRTSAGKLAETLRLSLVPPEEFYLESSDPRLPRPSAVREWSERAMRESLAAANGDLRQAVMIYDTYFHTLPDFFLTKVDRASMAHALEVRCPLLDVRFLELAARIPARWKADRKRSKILFREIVAGLVPDEIAARPKKGFTPPVLDWIGREDYRAAVREEVAEARRSGLPDSAWVDFYEREVLPADDAFARSMRLRMLVFRMWRKTWFEGR
jgi:asparagine synthase (glutamine-hydrolysing)